MPLGSIQVSRTARKLSDRSTSRWNEAGQSTSGQLGQSTGCVALRICAGAAIVAAKASRFWIGGILREEVRDEEGVVVRRNRWTTVPVVRNALLALDPAEVWILALDGEEGLVHAWGELALGISCAVVAHEVDDDCTSG